MKKRIFSILLIYCLVLSMLPMQVLAENNTLSGGANILPKSEETLNVGEVPASKDASTIEKASASEKVAAVCRYTGGFQVRDRCATF